MISSQTCQVVEPRPAVYPISHQQPIRTDNVLRLQLAPIRINQPMADLSSGSCQLESGSQDGSKKRNKPLMEKRRRQRINQAVEELRRLITDPNSKTASKLEKADILDLTVKYVKDRIASQRTQQQQQQQQQQQTPNPSLSNMQMFIQGHIACEMALRKLVDHTLTKQTDGPSSAQQTMTEVVTHILSELASNRQQLICRPNPSSTVRCCANSAFSPVMTCLSSPHALSSSSGSCSSNPIQPSFASPGPNSSTSTDSFPDLNSPPQLVYLNPTDQYTAVGLPVHNSTPTRTCLGVKNLTTRSDIPQTLSSMPKQIDGLSFKPCQPSPVTVTSASKTRNLWRPW